MTMKTAALAAALALSAAGGQARALSLTASVGSNDSFSLQGSHRIGPGLHAGLGYYDSGHRYEAYTASLTFAPALPLVDVGVGALYRYQDARHDSGGGLGVGASAYVPLPLPRVSVGGYGHYFPSGLAHGAVADSYEYGANARFRLVGDSHLFGGYRYLNTEFESQGSTTVESGWLFGVRVGF